MCLLQSEAAVGTEEETAGGSELLSRGEVSRSCLLYQECCSCGGALDKALCDTSDKGRHSQPQ